MNLNDTKVLNDGFSQFIRVFDLINDAHPISIGVIATIIEKYGIYTWDRFGRFGKAKKPDVMHILDTLADYKYWLNENLLDFDSGRSIYDFQGIPDLWNFGWDRLICPKFEVHDVVGPEFLPPPKNMPSEGRENNNSLRIIGVLLLLLVDSKRSELKKFPSNEKLVEYLILEHKYVEGISESTLKKRFAAAKKALFEI